MSQNHALALLATAISSALAVFAESLEKNPNPNLTQFAEPEIVTGVSSAPIVMEQAPLNTPTNNVGVANTTSNLGTNSGLLSAVETVAAGKELTGLELDNNGVPFLPAVNTKKPSLTTKGIYKKGVGISADVYAAAIAEAKAKQQAVTNVVETVANVASTVAPMPGQTASTPMPGQTASTPTPGVTAGAPMPGQTASAAHPNAHLREAILQEIAKLTNEMCVDFQSIAEILTEFKATDGTFGTVPLDEYPNLWKAVVGWNVCLQLIARSTAACLALNGNDQSIIIEYIYTQGQFGCTDPALVSKHDTWRLYEMLLGYQNQLETHFQKQPTAKAANPYA